MLFPVPDQALPLRIKIALSGAFQRLRLHASKARCVWVGSLVDIRVLMISLFYKGEALSNKDSTVIV